MTPANHSDEALHAVQKFNPLFKKLSIGFRMAKDRPGRIDEGYALRIEDENAGVFYINAAEGRQACFALNKNRYGHRNWKFWKQVTNKRTPAINRKGYETMAPLSEHEREALEELIEPASD